MKKIILAITMTVITSSSFAQIVQLFHYCHSNTKMSAGIAIGYDRDGSASEWLENLIKGGCSSISYCDRPVGIETAEDIISSDPFGSFDMNIKGWV